MPTEKAVPIDRAGVTRATEAAGVPASLSGRLLRAFLRVMGDPCVRFVLWNGDVVQGGDGEPVATLHIADARTLWRFVSHSELAFGEAFTDGQIKVEGDLVRLMEVAYQAQPHPIARQILQREPKPRANSRSGSRDNIHRHYDLGNDFYRLWLDRGMVYTCAYFPTPDTPLDEAQIAKMEHVCRKVDLRPGDKVVEAGCGWGSLALYMARCRGARVRAFNISREQIEFARERAKAEQVGDLVEFVEDDYRNISGHYDVFMSVGMLEHVGPDHYGELGRVIDRCLPAHGRGLIHTIGRNRPQRVNAWIEKYIFPGAMPPTLRQMMDIFEPFQLSVLDVENLRLHYAKTAQHWLERFLAHRSEVAKMFDERFARMWQLYLSGTIAGFTSATLELFQVTFARVMHNQMPWTRAHLYQE